MGGIATFGYNPKANTGITLGGSMGPASQTIQNSAPTSNQYLLSPQLLGASTERDDTSGTYSGSGSDTSTNQADIAAYKDQITSLNQLLSGADTTLNNGTSEINKNYDNNYNRLQGQQNGANATYAQQNQSSTNAYQKNLQGINSNARNGYNALQSILGGTGSAGDVLAPFAVSQQAGTQTDNSRDNYAENLAALALAKKNTDNKFASSFEDLGNQKNSKLQSLIASIDAQKQNYLSQIGAATNQLNIAQGGSYATPVAQNQAIAALQAQIGGLQSQYPDTNYTPQNVSPDAPDLSQYQAQAARLSQGSNSAPTADNSASLLSLLKQSQDKNAYKF